MSILQVGSTINEYKIVKLLGQDQLGATYLGHRQIYNQTTGVPIIKTFVIKTLNLSKVAELGLNPEAVEEEASILQQASSNPVCDQYITCYYTYFTHAVPVEQGQPMQYLIIVADYIQGPSLQQILLNQLGKGNFEMPKLVQMMMEIAQAVDYIHSRGIAHQNIKPSNIIYDTNTKRLRLIDFAFSCSQNLNTKCKGKAGTAYYMPPELLQSPTDPSEQDFALRAAHDIWSMGVVFYQLANPGKNFMNFTSNDPQIVAKDIQINNVKPSEYPYEPINSVIAAILNKDYTQRPTAGQVVIILRLAQPLCIINDQPYDRRMAEGLVTSLGLDVNPDIDDYTLCKTLTDHLNICKIRGNDYQKKHLLQTAKIIGIKVDESVESAVLCDMIQKGLQTQQDKYSEYVTQELLRSLEYMAFIQARAASETEGELKDVLKQLQERYTVVYNEAKNLGLINLELLESRRKDVTRKSLVYAQNASVTYARVYELLAKKIVDVILAVNPDAEVGGVPLSEFQRRIFTR